MFDDFALGQAEEVVEGGVGAVAVAFADGEDKIAFGEEAVEAVVI